MRRRSAPFLGLSPREAQLPDSLSDDIALADRLLGELLHEQEDGVLLGIARRLYREAEGEDPRDIFERIPELKDPRLVQRVLRAYTVLFQLLNTAEQKEIVRVNCERQARAGGSPRSESIAEAVETLRAAGTSASGMQQLIDRLDICPTLTAHPTEARRRSVLDKLQTIAEALSERMHARIAEEHRLSCEWILRITGQQDLLEHAPVVRRTVKLRNPAVTPLSKLQVALLDLLHKEAEAGREPDSAWQEAMLLSITGIAAAMQSTG